eukprot:7211827-Pyramimonas_sp.AAC.1
MMGTQLWSTRDPERSEQSSVDTREPQRGSRGGLEGIYLSSLDARKSQNPTYSEEYRGHLQGVLYST